MSKHYSKYYYRCLVFQAYGKYILIMLNSNNIWETAVLGSIYCNISQYYSHFQAFYTLLLYTQMQTYMLLIERKVENTMRPLAAGISSICDTSATVTEPLGLRGKMIVRMYHHSRIIIVEKCQQNITFCDILPQENTIVLKQQYVVCHCIPILLLSQGLTLLLAAWQHMTPPGCKLRSTSCSLHC